MRPGKRNRHSNGIPSRVPNPKDSGPSLATSIPREDVEDIRKTGDIPENPNDDRELIGDIVRDSFAGFRGVIPISLGFWFTGESGFFDLHSQSDKLVRIFGYLLRFL